MKDQLYMDYHDNERGIPIHNDQKHFEYLLLETFQAGLSWYTILSKRGEFRKAFDDFDYKKIADYTDLKIEELLLNSGIIRHRGKIEAAIRNAQIFIDIQKAH
jgi:DNA-3-methyladenine glycosylase I